MSEQRLAQTADKPMSSAEAHERLVQQELNLQYEELRDQARALFAAAKGRRGVGTEKQWKEMFQRAAKEYGNGRFLITQLGAETYLEPSLIATLAQIRSGLLDGIEHPTVGDQMMADSAVIAYRNMIRVQGWIGSLSLTFERELFGQAPLSEIHGPTVGQELANEIARLEEILMPLLERSHRMMEKSIAHLDRRRGKSSEAVAVTVEKAGQVNVASDVKNSACS